MSTAYAEAREELVESLDTALRAAVRAEGVDPQRDASLVRRLAADVVVEHDQRSLTGVVAPVEDQDAVVDELVARVSGFGALQRYLDDPTVEEIWINQPSRVFVARAGRHELTTTLLTTTQVHELVERMLKSSGRRVDLSVPFVDATLPGGHRLHVVLEGISRGFSAVNIRKFVVRAARLHDLVGLDSLTEQAAAFLDASVQAGLNVVVAGGTQSGKPAIRIATRPNVLVMPMSVLIALRRPRCVGRCPRRGWVVRLGSWVWRGARGCSSRSTAEPRGVVRPLSAVHREKKL